MDNLDLRKSYSLRGKDRHGYGHFGASRGNRVHKGIDVVSEDGQPVSSCSDGVVTKIGYPYSHDLSYRYVQVTVGENSDTVHERYFYCLPNDGIEVGASVKAGQVIGAAQDLCCTYGGITPHIHFEIKTPKGVYLDPIKYLVQL